MHAAEIKNSGAGRLLGLDAFRGYTVAAMILVNNPGTWGAIYPPLRHAEWHGCTPTDLIFPFFLFIVGAAAAFSIPKYTRDGLPTTAFWVRVFRRCALLIGLGILLNVFPVFDLAAPRLTGVLQRIGIVYLLLAMMVVFLPRRGQLGLAVGILASYWALLAFVPVPQAGQPLITPEQNWPKWIDDTLLGWRYTYRGADTDPEGLLSTLPSLVTAWIGFRVGGLFKSKKADAAAPVALLGIGLAAAGLALALHQPMNKPLWTPSYTLFTAGLGSVVLAGCVVLFDAMGQKKLARPGVVFGVNAITVFVGSGLVARLLVLGGQSSPKAWIYREIFDRVLDGAAASLAYACTFLVLCWLVLLLMDRLGIRFRV